jgi:hypothetical protein
LTTSWKSKFRQYEFAHLLGRKNLRRNIKYEYYLRNKVAFLFLHFCLFCDPERSRLMSHHANTYAASTSEAAVL